MVSQISGKISRMHKWLKPGIFSAVHECLVRDYHCVCPSVHLSVCLCTILQCVFLCDGTKLSNEICNATTAQHSNTAKLAKFLL